MGYTEDDAMVRVDFFKPDSGKWYCTESIKWLHYDNPTYSIHEIFKMSLDVALGPRLFDMIAVCLEPHHIHSHPVMLKGRR